MKPFNSAQTYTIFCLFRFFWFWLFYFVLFCAVSVVILQESWRETVYKDMVWIRD